MPTNHKPWREDEFRLQFSRELKHVHTVKHGVKLFVEFES